jgi:hypothetical protein
LGLDTWILKETNVDSLFHQDIRITSDNVTLFFFAIEISFSSFVSLFLAYHTEKEAIKIAEKICKKGPYCPNTKKNSSVVSYLGASQIYKIPKTSQWEWSCVAHFT